MTSLELLCLELPPAHGSLQDPQEGLHIFLTSFYEAREGTMGIPTLALPQANLHLPSAHPVPITYPYIDLPDRGLQEGQKWKGMVCGSGTWACPFPCKVPSMFISKGHELGYIC